MSTSPPRPARARTATRWRTTPPAPLPAPPTPPTPGRAATCRPPSGSGVGLGVAGRGQPVHPQGGLPRRSSTAAICVGVWELRAALAPGGGSTSRSCPPLVGAVAMIVRGVRRRGRGADRVLRPDLRRRCCSGGRPTGCRTPSRDVAGGIFVAAYVPFLAGVRHPDAGRAGRRLADLRLHPRHRLQRRRRLRRRACSLGRHPMAPSVSPKKSWEGFAGSVGRLRRSAACCRSSLAPRRPLVGRCAARARRRRHGHPRRPDRVD